MRGGWVDPDDLPKGPNDRALCRFCQQEVPKGRRTFCSKRCVAEWCVRTGKRVDRYIFDRDRGVCVACRLDCHQLLRVCLQLPPKERAEFKRLHNIPEHRYRRFWDIDHVLPVSEGGGQCGLENLRTLCLPCHRRATAELRGRLAKQR